MPRVYEINMGDKWTIPLQQYENRSPMVNIKRIITLEDGIEIDFSKELDDMRELVFLHLNKCRDEILGGKKEETIKSFRFYEHEGKKYPSVTTIISPEPYTGNPAYGLRGDIIHRVFSRWVSSGKYYWDITEEEKQQLKDIGGLDPKEWDLQWLSKKNYDFNLAEEVVYNEEHLYAGRFDAIGFDGDLKAIWDLKTGNMGKPEQEKAFMQMSAYAKCLDGIQAMIILPVNPKGKKEPIVSTDIDGYFAKFLQKRKEFKEKHGI